MILPSQVNRWSEKRTKLILLRNKERKGKGGSEEGKGCASFAIGRDRRLELNRARVNYYRQQSIEIK